MMIRVMIISILTIIIIVIAIVIVIVILIIIILLLLLLLLLLRLIMIILRPISVLRFWSSEGRLRQNLKFKGWDSQVQRRFPGMFESTNLRRENLSREIGRRVGIS